MAFSCTDTQGVKLTETTTTKDFQLGTIVKGQDATLGMGEFIYLLGVASTIVGSVVTYNPSTWQTKLGVVAVNIAAPVAFAMSANVASQYGWYQIGGIATAAKTATLCLVVGVRVAAATNSGAVIASASAAGLDIEGCVVAATASAAAGRTTVSLSVNRPHIQGRVA